MFGLLSAFWGASYLFIKVALEDDMAPAFIVFARCALAAMVLLPAAAHIGALAGLRERLRPLVVLAFVQVTVPFTLITIGEQEISSSLTGILVASAPIFTFLLAFVLPGAERAGPLSLFGVAIGIAGVALLLGVDAPGGTSAVVGGLLVVLATLGYGIGAWFLKRRLPGVQPVGAVGATSAATALMVLPFAAFQVPDHAPGIDAAASLVALGVLCTGLAFVFFYSLVASEGPAKASLVAYVAPAFSVVYGVTLLDERFTAATAAGLLLIVGGSWVAAEGRLPWRRRVEAAAKEEVPAEADAAGVAAAGEMSCPAEAEAPGGAEPAADGTRGVAAARELA
jgi:drug/metabolite transporter (DMT)-like permease